MNYRTKDYNLTLKKLKLTVSLVYRARPKTLSDSIDYSIDSSTSIIIFLQ